MAVITNENILSAIEFRDLKSPYFKGEIKEALEVSFRPSLIFKLSGNQKLAKLMKRLGKSNYILDSDDIKILRKYNIFVNERSRDQIKSGSSFVAISDFHGYEYPIEKTVDYYLNEYDAIYILGDAVDRGSRGDGKGSLELLERIKNLMTEYKGRIFYIPGNHDEFLVGAARGDQRSIDCMLANGGKGTFEDLKLLKESNPKAFHDLIGWLENLPIQRIHHFNGINYALAHAFFDNILYSRLPNYSLKDMFSSQGDLSKRASNVLWFRKSRNSYDKKACPDAKNTIVVIGHSITDKGSREHDLVDSSGRKVRVHCVDGGIASGWDMLKYDGKSKTLSTRPTEHNNTSPGRVGSHLEANTAYLHNYFIKYMYLYEEQFFQYDTYFIPNDLSGKEVFEVIDSYEGKYGFSYGTDNYQEKYLMYKKIFAFDLIVQNLFERYKDAFRTCDQLDCFFSEYEEENPDYQEWITRNSDTRFFAKTLGVDNMLDVLAKHNCSSPREYFDLKRMDEQVNSTKIMK